MPQRAGGSAISVGPGDHLVLASSDELMCDVRVDDHVDRIAREHDFRPEI
jgi:hypothetical protein